MAGIFDYLAWRGDLTFRQVPFNPVDNIILTHLSYLPLDGIVPGPEEKGIVSIAEAAGQFAANKKESPSSLIVFKEDPAFLSALGSCERYRNMSLSGYVNEIDPLREIQFAALTILTGDGSAFITYRGTDNSLVGWKEDFNMSFSEAVPAQQEAVGYLEKMARRFSFSLRIGGHSKGGNLAVYAAAFCEHRIRERILEVYSNDAPGFSRRVITSKGYRAIRKKIYAFIPETSVIGMLFEHDSDYTVVKSSGSGLLQHDVYTWEVHHNDVVRLNQVSRESRFIDRTLKEWIGGLNYEQRQMFTETIYAILTSTEASSVPQLGADWLKNTVVMLQSLVSIDNASRNLVFKTLGALLRAAKNNIYTLLPQEPGKNSSGPLKKRPRDGQPASGAGA